MNYHGKIEETDTLIGNMGLGVDYYKGEQGIPGKDGKDGKDGSDQVYIGADEPTDERVKLWIDTDATPSSGGTADTIDWSKVQNKPNFADVATSGDYNDLVNKPAIPSVEGLASEAYVNEKVAAIKVPSLDGYAKTADLSTVATSGSYNDLLDKPSIPSTTGLASEAYVNEKVAAIVIPEVPTKVSELENDAGYLTEHQSLADYSTTAQVQTMISSAIGAITNGNEVSY